MPKRALNREAGPYKGEKYDYSETYSLVVKYGSNRMQDVACLAGYISKELKHPLDVIYSPSPLTRRDLAFTIDYIENITKSWRPYSVELDICHTSARVVFSKGSSGNWVLFFGTLARLTTEMAFMAEDVIKAEGDFSDRTETAFEKNYNWLYGFNQNHSWLAQNRKYSSGVSAQQIWEVFKNVNDYHAKWERTYDIIEGITI